MLRRLVVAMCLVAGCDDTLFPSGAPSGVAADAEGWCAVQGMLAARCVGCHSAGAALGGLDLETDPHGTLLDGVSQAFGEPLLVPGDPDASLLMKKLSGIDGYGSPMPPSGDVGDPLRGRVEQWIIDGADDACDAPVTGEPGAGYHPAGWVDPAIHGLGAKLQDDVCTSCHGADLTGGTVGVACADCHAAVVDDWTTSCTFCHGDRAEGNPAPPQDIDDNDDPSTITFPAHRVHLDSPLHAPWGCTQCHVEPTSVFSPGHVFVDDTTPGRADLDFSEGLSPAGRATATGCANVYCHGDGRGTGSVDRTATVGCGGCHPVQRTPARWGGLSEPHERHLDEGIRCAACHPTVDDAGDLVDRVPHLDGEPTVAVDGLVRGADGRCTGTCHGETHNSRVWADD